MALPFLARTGPLMARSLASGPFVSLRAGSMATGVMRPAIHLQRTTLERAQCTIARMTPPAGILRSMGSWPTCTFDGRRCVRPLHLSAAMRSAAAPMPASPITDTTPAVAVEHDVLTTKRTVAYHLFFCAFLVYLIIVVGGLTRLTESGLSITEWNPGFKGMRLPWSDDEWSEEWEKYKQTPEWAVLNRHMTVDDFKSIYLWEWSHRMIGRLIGVAFVAPAAYFVVCRRVAPGTRWKLAAIGLGIGFQGALGWFMVKSGLSAPKNETSLRNANETSDWHPRVSHFRLAAHLGTAFLVYLGMLHTGMAILRDDGLARGHGRVAGLSLTDGKASVDTVLHALTSSGVNRLRVASRAMLALTFLTAMTGALVAGLDAGLVYSEFPYMGESFIPPREEVLDERYAWNKALPTSPPSSASKTADLVIGNATQNPVTVQLMHRCLAVTTLISAIALGVYARRVSRSTAKSLAVTQQYGFMPPAVPRWAALVSVTAVMQASLGISTLIYLVPIELASAHQAGSVALLSSIVALLAVLRKPNGRVLQQLLRRRSSVLAAQQQQSASRQAAISRAVSKVMVVH